MLQRWIPQRYGTMFAVRTIRRSTRPGFAAALARSLGHRWSLHAILLLAVPVAWGCSSGASPAGTLLDASTAPTEPGPGDGGSGAEGGAETASDAGCTPGAADAQRPAPFIHCCLNDETYDCPTRAA